MVFQKCDISDVVYLVKLSIETGLKVMKKIIIKEAIDYYMENLRIRA